jgi:hypothetical protein
MEQKDGLREQSSGGGLCPDQIVVDKDTVRPELHEGRIIGCQGCQYSWLAMRHH